jgi:elongation factor Ts
VVIAASCSSANLLQSSANGSSRHWCTSRFCLSFLKNIEDIDMAAITASMVKELRDRTGLAMMECKKALEEAGGDVELAIDNLRKSGQAKAAKKAGNIAADGAIIIAQDGNKVLMLEVNSQTDFVAKDSNFAEFANNVAQVALANNTTDVAAIAALPYADGQTVEEARIALVQKIGENIQVRRAVIVEGENLATYKHGLKIGVVVSYTGGNEETGKGMAMHVAAFNPIAINAEGVAADVLAKEKEIAEAKALESGKPANIVEKMVTGSIQKFLNEVTLTNQMYVIDNEKKVEDVLKAAGMTVTQFLRLEVGEGIEKKEVNFADEVAAAVEAAK